MENDESGRDARRPVDIFDPTDDGFTPHKMSAVVDAAAAVSEALTAYEAALKGCMTPLNLAKVLKDVTEAREALAPDVRRIARARDIIEGDVPLARQFNVNETSWWEPGEGIDRGLALTPRQLTALARQADKVGESETVTYREAITQSAPVPFLVAQARREKRQDAKHRERLEQIAVILDDIKIYPCPYCEAAAGNTCVTNSGRTGGPHADRMQLSPEMKGNWGLREHLKWFNPEGNTQRWRENQEAEREVNLENQELVGEVIAELVDLTTPRYD